MSEIPEEAIDAASVANVPRGVMKAILEAAYPAIREQVLADAKARIEGLKVGTIQEVGKAYNAGISAALAALTQTGKCEGYRRDRKDG